MRAKGWDLPNCFTRKKGISVTRTGNHKKKKEELDWNLCKNRIEKNMRLEMVFIPPFPHPTHNNSHVPLQLQAAACNQYMVVLLGEMLLEITTPRAIALK